MNGELNGNGKCVYANGTVYEGQWLKNKLEGNGKCVYADGEVYDGQWLNGNRN